MLKSLVLVILFSFFSFPALADSVSSYSVNGTGGLAAPQAGVSTSSFWWTDSTANVDLASVLNFNPLPASPSGASGWTGSLIVSNPFTVGATNSLNVDFEMFSIDAQNFTSLAFAVLLQNSQVVDILSVSRSDGFNHIGDFGDIVPGVVFAQPSAGVTTTMTRPGVVPVNIGGIPYGYSPDGFAYCAADFCQTNVSSTVTPGAGTYQIAFGTFQAGGSNRNEASTVAVKTVTVPEGSTAEFGLLCLVLLGTSLFLARKPLQQ